MTEQNQKIDQNQKLEAGQVINNLLNSYANADQQLWSGFVSQLVGVMNSLFQEIKNRDDIIESLKFENEQLKDRIEAFTKRPNDLQ